MVIYPGLQVFLVKISWFLGKVFEVIRVLRYCWFGCSYFYVFEFKFFRILVKVGQTIKVRSPGFRVPLVKLSKFSAKVIEVIHVLGYSWLGYPDFWAVRLKYPDFWVFWVKLFRFFDRIIKAIQALWCFCMFVSAWVIQVSE